MVSRRRQFTRRLRAPHLDFVTGYVFFWVILVYIAAFGYFRTSGFVLTEFDLAYLVVLLPIWLVDGIKGLLESFTIRQYLTGVQNLRKVTVIVPCKDGEKEIGPTIKSLLRRFKSENVILVSNGSTDRTVEIGEGFGIKVLEIKAAVGKVAATHYALKYVKTPYVLLIDDDTLIGRAKIPTELLNKRYDGVAFRVLVKVSNWLSLVQMYEYRKTTDLGKRYHNKQASVQNISGAIGLFRLDKLKREMNRHTGEYSGDDLQRTLLLHLNEESRGVVLTSSTVVTRPPVRLSVLFKQRTYGWFPGLYSNFVNYAKILFNKKTPGALRFDAFYNVVLVMVMDVVRLMSLPILIFYPWYFVVMYFAYFVMELVAHNRCCRRDPFWVVLIYPLYGLFSFMTRVCAFAVFMYRRVCIGLAHARHRDDFRFVSPVIKWVSIVITLGVLSTLLVLNVVFFYIDPILNFKFW